MAGVLATVEGIAIRPGVSLNRRLYSPQVLAGAVARAQKRIEAGESLDLVDRTDEPLSQLTHHAAEDDSTRVVGRITSLSVGKGGEVRFKAAIAPTEHGKTIATLLDTSDGKPAYLKGVSIRGAWLGTPRTVTAPDGKPATAGEALELDGLDYTRKPGVVGAQVTGFRWADGRPPDETAETGADGRVPISESVQEAQVTFTEGIVGEAGPEVFVPAEAGQVVPHVPEGVREALALVLGPVWEGDSATPAMSKRKSGLSGGGRKWADPGYQSDKRQRYDITTKSKALTAWRYIHQASKAAKYSGAQLKQIKARIRAALKGFGVSVSTEHAPGWGFEEAYQVTPGVAEFYGDPSRAGSWCVTASNGPVNLSLSCYSMDPADLNVVIRAAADAACKALAALDPDMDGDIDVPGASSSDADDDAGHESAPEDGVTEDAPATESQAAGQAAGEAPAAAGTKEQEDAGMATESTTEAGGTAPAGLTLETVTEALAGVFEARDTAKAQRKKAAKEAEAKEAREAAARKTALTEALSELGIKVPGAATESAAGGGTAAESGGTAPITEADVDQRVQAAVQEALTEYTQGLVTSGALPLSRAGLAVKEHAAPTEDEAKTGEDLRKMGDDDLMSYLGAAQIEHGDRIRPVGGR